MGVGCKPNTSMRLGLLPSFQSPFTGNSSPAACSPSFKGREVNLESTKQSFACLTPEESGIACKDSFIVYTCLSSAPSTSENDYVDFKRTITERQRKDFLSSVKSLQMPHEREIPVPVAGTLADNKSRYHLLMENVDVLEQSITDSNSMELEKDILVQLGRLGALEIFRTFLSKTVTDPPASDGTCKADVFNRENNQEGEKGDWDVSDIVVRSQRKEKRRLKRDMAGETSKKPSLEGFESAFVLPANSFPSNKRKRSGKRLAIAENEAKMSYGVKVVADLERIRQTLEIETGKEISLRSWAEAAGIDEIVLQRRLYVGWRCRDELITSARSLVLYLARTYKGLGIAPEDLIQAGNIGVLQGAVRFDHTRGYKFSTYVQYWIRKAMSRFVSRHARGIRIPPTLSSALGSVQKARKTLLMSCGKYPDDLEIAKLTGLSLERINSATNCLRVVGSTDQKINNDWSNLTFLDYAVDMTVDNPETTVMRQHMKNDIRKLLNNLEPKEKRILVLRYGFGGNQMKSLHEIGKLFNVSKEWIRRVEKKALAKLRDEKIQMSLRHYVDL